MPGYEEAKPFSSYQKERLKYGYITAHKDKLTSTQKDSQIFIFVAVMANTMLF